MINHVFRFDASLERQDVEQKREMNGFNAQNSPVTDALKIPASRNLRRFLQATTTQRGKTHCSAEDSTHFSKTNYSRRLCRWMSKISVEEEYFLALKIVFQVQSSW